jgi:branched-chain amino acid transport system permease protein
VGQLLQAVWGGLVFGSVYGLMAVGLTLIWGSLNLLNLAHGGIYVAGGYVAYTLMVSLGFSAVFAFAGAMLASAALGLILYAVVVVPMLGKPGWDNASWIATVAVSLVLESALLLVYGPEVRAMPAAIEGAFVVNDVVFRYQAILVCAVAVVLLVLLHLFLKTSRFGLAIRAVSQQIDASRLMGIPVALVFLIVMGVSASLSGLAGAMLTSILALSPTAGFVPMLKALIVTIFGGLGSVKGTIVAAYVIGLLEAFVQAFAGVAWSLPALFLFIIAVLLVRPQGLFGTPELQRL